MKQREMLLIQSQRAVMIFSEKPAAGFAFVRWKPQHSSATGCAVAAKYLLFHLQLYCYMDKRHNCSEWMNTVAVFLFLFLFFFFFAQN
jgi:hypothetical protein